MGLLSNEVSSQKKTTHTTSENKIDKKLSIFLKRFSIDKKKA